MLARGREIEPVERGRSRQILLIRVDTRRADAGQGRADRGREVQDGLRQSPEHRHERILNDEILLW